MKINVYLRRQRDNPSSYSGEMLAMIEGLRRHGLQPEVLDVRQPQRCDVAVMWGFKKPLHRQIAKRSLILERGYVGDRHSWTSVGWDGLNGFAQFCNSGMPGVRWSKHFAHLMRPWRQREGYVLVVGQVPGDQSLRGMDIHDWVRRAARDLHTTDRPARIRLHPLDRSHATRMVRHSREWQRGWYLQGSLEEALAGAAYVVTYNSNTAVDAVLAGVPTVTVDRGSMAWPVTGHDAHVVPPTPARDRWAHELAWAQWSIDELAAGDAWDHIKRGLLVHV